MTLHEVRDDTPGCRQRIHFNNAGTSLTPAPVQKVLLDHLELEQSLGGYEAELEAAEALERVYGSLARLVGAESSEIAISQNATRAWDMIFYALPLGPGDKILTCRCEYASNYIAFLQRCRQSGAQVVVLENDESGAVSLDSLIHNLDSRVKVVAINHMPTNGGLVQPVEEIGKALADHPAFYLVDACQSVGQMPIDVKAIRCQALTATSRKYLRGPRGVGFLYLATPFIERLEPPFLDLHAATWTAPGEYQMRPDARRFETYELFLAGKLALGAAAEYALELDVAKTWTRIQKLGTQLRQGLNSLPQVRVHDLGRLQGGIVTFSVAGMSPPEVRAALYARGINVWTCTVRSARLDMEARGLEEVVRASVHYYNSEAEIETFLIQLHEIIEP